MTDWINRKAELISTPYYFLCWYLRCWEDDTEMPGFEDCIVSFFADRGVTDVEVWCLGDSDGFIKLKAGVQSITVKSPEWMDMFLDSIGHDPDVNSRYSIATHLLSVVIEAERTDVEAWTKHP